MRAHEKPRSMLESCWNRNWNTAFRTNKNVGVCTNKGDSLYV